MNILSAIYAGRTGFLKSTVDMAKKADEIAKVSSDPAAQNNFTQDVIGMKVDQIAAKANLKSFSMSSDLLRELVQIGKKK